MASRSAVTRSRPTAQPIPEAPAFGSKTTDTHWLVKLSVTLHAEVGTFTLMACLRHSSIAASVAERMEPWLALHA